MSARSGSGILEGPEPQFFNERAIRPCRRPVLFVRRLADILSKKLTILLFHPIVVNLSKANMQGEFSLFYLYKAVSFLRLISAKRTGREPGRGARGTSIFILLCYNIHSRCAGHTGPPAGGQAILLCEIAAVNVTG